MHQFLDSNPFTLLGLATRFDLDAARVEQAYLTKCTQVHPDVGDGGSAQLAAGLNRARAVLLDPESRANALLEFFAGPSAGECKDLPDGFLMDMMSIRQEIEEQLADGGSDARDHWESWARQQRAEYTLSAQSLFGALKDPPEPEQLTQIRMMLNAWRYIERLIEQLDPEYDPARADFR